MFPTPLSMYPPPSPDGLLATLSARLHVDPFNGIATAIFAIAIAHTFMAARFTRIANRMQARCGDRPSVLAELTHFFGEVEVVFGLWAVALVGAMVLSKGWSTAAHYVNATVNYTEPLFVFVIMAIAATRPIVTLAEDVLRRVAAIGSGTPAAWWVATLTIGPLLGSFITEPAAMTICALVLSRQFYDLEPSARLKYATLGLLFVNVSIGGTLTHFAAPPVLMVARPWGWTTGFMLGHFGVRAALAIVLSNAAYFFAFRSELRGLAAKARVPDVDQTDQHTVALQPVPVAITAVHVLVMAWTVYSAHYPALFIGSFLFFLGFVKATAPYQAAVDLKTPMLVGFFLAGLVIHGGLQAWWIAPVLASLTELPMFLGATFLTSFNDNALITYLATLVPNLSDGLKTAVMEGAVTGGGLTVIANAPNPAGQALLSRFFKDAVSPAGLFAAAAIPTVIAAVCFLL